MEGMLYETPQSHTGRDNSLKSFHATSRPLGTDVLNDQLNDPPNRAELLLKNAGVPFLSEPKRLLCV
jgi:hypothetical protein